MIRATSVFVLMLALGALLSAAPKPHVVALGTAQPVTLKLEPGNDSIRITVRALYVDTKLKEYTTGPAHDVTDRQFVVRRAFRVNDGLPGDPPKTPKWLWQRGTWLLVDRSSGRITQLKLPDFDSLYSDVSWYRDYAAYCGTAGNGERLLAVVAQIGSRKALYRKELGTLANDAPQSVCGTPHWERQPARVTFAPTSGAKFSVTVSGRVSDLPDTPAEE